MMNFLGTLVSFIMAVTFGIMLLCVAIIGLAVLDYALDSDIKGALVKWLGPRHFLKKIRINMVRLMKRIDTPSAKEQLYFGESMWKSDEDYDAEIKKLLDQIDGETK